MDIIFYLLLILLLVEESDAKVNSNNWTFEYSVSNLDNFGNYLPSISLGYKENYTLLYTKEWPEFEYQNSSNFLEYYKGNYYLIIGQGKYEEKVLGIDYTFKTATFGLRLNNYKDNEVIFYKFQKDYYIKDNFVLSGRVTGIEAEEFNLNYMLKLKYNFVAYSHYFDLEDLNKGIIEISPVNETNKYMVKISYGQDFKTKDNGFSLSLGTKF